MDDNFDIEGYVHKMPSELNPVSGQLLIAAPMMADPYFSRSVAVILDNDRGTHMGLTLNLRSDANVSMIFPHWSGLEHIPLFVGGPVDLERLFVVHRLGSMFDGSLEVIPGLYVGGNEQQLYDYLASGGETEGVLRFFCGYSGWGENQLVSEIVGHSWAVGQTDDMARLLEDSGESYWRREVRHLGPEYRSWLNLPQHPLMN